MGLRIKRDFQFKVGEKFEVFNSTPSGRVVSEGIVELVREGEGQPFGEGPERMEPWWVKFEDGDYHRWVMAMNKVGG